MSGTAVLLYGPAVLITPATPVNKVSGRRTTEPERQGTLIRCAAYRVAASDLPENHTQAEPGGELGDLTSESARAVDEPGQVATVWTHVLESNVKYANASRWYPSPCQRSENTGPSPRQGDPKTDTPHTLNVRDCRYSGRRSTSTYSPSRIASCGVRSQSPQQCSSSRPAFPAHCATCSADTGSTSSEK